MEYFGRPDCTNPCQPLPALLYSVNGPDCLAVSCWAYSQEVATVVLMTCVSYKRQFIDLWVHHISFWDKMFAQPCGGIRGKNASPCNHHLIKLRYHQHTWCTTTQRQVGLWHCKRRPHLHLKTPNPWFNYIHSVDAWMGPAILGVVAKFSHNYQFSHCMCSLNSMTTWACNRPSTNV